jgi:hypothetical protein
MSTLPLALVQPSCKTQEEVDEDEEGEEEVQEERKEVEEDTRCFVRRARASARNNYKLL